MTLTDLAQDLQKQQAVTQHVNRYIWRNTVKPLVNDDIVEEHRADPIGRHSPLLDLVLGFLRSDPVPQRPRLVVVIITPEQEWAIGEHSRRKGETIRVRPGTYASIPEIEHAIFLERLKDATEVYG